MYSISSIAKKILSLGEKEKVRITHLKLQKLFYFAQGWHLACIKKSLFDEDLQAWDHGPVVFPLYKKCRGAGPYNVIKQDLFPKKTEKITGESLELLKAVFKQYKQYSGTALEFISHQHKPWQIAYSKGRNSLIEKEDIRLFFRQHYLGK